MHITISWKGAIDEDQTEFEGALIVDYCPVEGLLWLDVDIDEVDADYRLEGGLFPDEAWGQIKMVEEVSLDIKSCKWGGHAIINDEEVCWAVEDSYE